MKLTNYFLTFLFILSLPCISNAQLSGKFYTDYRKNTVYIPLGPRAFVDYVVNFQNGNPASTGSASNSTNSIGRPDYQQPGDNDKITSLGCGGSITYKFEDNALIDIKGADLYVFEAGETKEPSEVHISADGETWRKAGIIDGGTSGIDLADVLEEDEFVQFVKLVDTKTFCSNSPNIGADIDAVAAIGSMKIRDKSDGREVVYKDKIQTRAESITIQLWDDLVEDGDTVTLKLNDEIIMEHHRVTKKPETFTIKLKDPDSDLIMYAENLGNQPPNTAAIRIFYGDQERKLVLSSDMESSEAIKILQR